MTDGPRPLRTDEWEQLNALVSAVFRPTMFANYPQLFNEQNRQNLRVVAEDGKVVCHVGMIERPAALMGCRIDVACIGAVATYDEYRGNGFASRAFQDCCDKAAADGIDVMLISGGRGLYTRVGCRRVGQDWDFAIDSQGADSLRSLASDSAVLSPLGVESVSVLRALYQVETVRFLRPLEDWRMAFDCRVVMARSADFWGVSLGGTPIAYLIVNPPSAMRRSTEDPSIIRVAEFAGDRTAITVALPRLIDHYGAERLTIHVQGTDTILRTHLSRADIVGTPSPTWGTLRVINFPRLMERCRPLLAERIGAVATQDVRFEADERPGSAHGGFTIRRGSEAVRIPDLGTLAHYLFGMPDGASIEPEGSPRLAAELAEALPLPSLWYGISYV
jgi:predicted N-acetyltransferase YhbS